jgi:hypothetical protein
MKKLFNYRPEGKTISTDDGDKALMVIRKGPRGIIAMVRGEGPILIWDKKDVGAHESDDEATLTQKVIDVLNA